MLPYSILKINKHKLKLMCRKQSCLMIFSVLFLLVQQTVSSQEEDDFELWSSIGIAYKANKKLSIGLEEQLRLKENASTIDSYFTQLDATYEIIKNVSLGGGLRYIKKNDNQGKVQGYENHFRYHINASYKHKINDFSLKYRLRYQNKNELGISTDDGDVAKQNLRLKASIGYSISNWKLDPKFSAEIFNRLADEDANGLRKLRLTLSTDYKLKKLGKIKLFYRFEKSLNIDTSTIINILGFKYTYTFKNK